MNSVIENIQYQNSCGYIATKAVFLQYLAGKDWFKVDIIQDTVIIALKMIEDGNKILGKPPGKTYDLEASEIVILLGEYLEISGNKRGTVHKIIDIPPMQCLLMYSSQKLANLLKKVIVELALMKQNIL